MDGMKAASGGTRGMPERGDGSTCESRPVPRCPYKISITVLQAMGRGLLPGRLRSSSLVFGGCDLGAGRYVDRAQRDRARDYDDGDGGHRDPGVERGGDEHVERRAEHGRRACHETEEREELAASCLGRDLREEAPGERLAASQHQADRRAQRQPLVADAQSQGLPEPVPDEPGPPVDRAVPKDRRVPGADPGLAVQGAALDRDRVRGVLSTAARRP